MKIFLALCLSLFAASNSVAQLYVNDVLIDTLHTPFCQLTCENAGGLAKARILIDFGQNYVDNGISRQKFMDIDRKPITFNSSVDALNFMARHGWELSSFKMRGETYIYLLQRRKAKK